MIGSTKDFFTVSQTTGQILSVFSHRHFRVEKVTNVTFETSWFQVARSATEPTFQITKKLFSLVNFR